MITVLQVEGRKIFDIQAFLMENVWLFMLSQFSHIFTGLNFYNSENILLTYT